MKIAVVVPPWLSLPPKGYGGIESVAQLLVDGMVSAGHDVTLFTVGGSETKAKQKWLFDSEQIAYLDAPASPFLSAAVSHALFAYQDIAAGDFDVVADHTWKEGLLCAEFVDVPVVHTLHSPYDFENASFYRQHRSDNVSFTSISRSQRSEFNWLENVTTVYNGVELSKYPFKEAKEDFFFYLGRFNENKAPHLACEAANKLGEKLILAGKVSEAAERDYFDEFIKPQLSDNVSFVGPVGFYSKEKLEYLSNAKALLNPIQWDEPFGIVMAEALACGTPVVTFAKGAAPEIVTHGETGFCVSQQHEFIEAVESVAEISSARCRQTVEERFSTESMIKGYISVYESAAK